MFGCFNFVNCLSSDALYSVIPIITESSNADDPYMVLGRSFVVFKLSINIFMKDILIVWWNLELVILKII
jgi:hypothetical protein